MRGVLSTCVGYTGGTTPDPTYERIGDHTEALLVEFDESVTYEEILHKFFAESTPGVSSRQYRSAIFVHDREQRAVAEEMQALLINRGKRWYKHTAIEDASPFYRAEDYHQHYLRNLFGLEYPAQA